MNEFFEADTNPTTADALERRMQREERRHGERRKLATRIAGVAIAASLVLGGVGAYATTHSTPKVTPKVSHAKVVKAKHHKKKVSHKN
jgi:hypothetical protein